ncbi:hypothetical protein HOY82DRAFT_671498 [Tuber indicum]|nr:hypothetical protein HOY82DRAFT_671498 [Tuber indicum]
MGRRVMGNRMFASPLRNGNGGTFNAILATRPKVRRGEEMRWTAKKSLARVLHQEDLHIKNVMDEPCVGNRLGLDLAGLSAKLAAVEAIITSQQEELSGLTKKVISLTIPTEGYLLSDGKIIGAGNLAAHQSDVLGDAMLYISPHEGVGRGPKRNDPDTFKALYGLKPKLAFKIKHEQTVKVLNAHADSILSNPQSVTEKLPESLEKIVEVLVRFGGDEGYPDELAQWQTGGNGRRLNIGRGGTWSDPRLWPPPRQALLLPPPPPAAAFTPGPYDIQSDTGFPELLFGGSRR